MTDLEEQVFGNDLPEPPAGYARVAFRRPRQGETYVDQIDGEVLTAIADHAHRCDKAQLIVERVSDTYEAAQWYSPSTVLGAPIIKVDLSSKPTNPKDAIGSSKLPLHLWPSTATVFGCLALLEGALKYGRSNWRSAGVKASIYVDALDRHMKAWMEGEDCAPDSKIPHLGHALACIAILIDAGATGKLVDDRNFNGAGYHELVEEMTSHVERLKLKYVDECPHHFTIADAVEGSSEPL